MRERLEYLAFFQLIHVIYWALVLAYAWSRHPDLVPVISAITSGYSVIFQVSMLKWWLGLTPEKRETRLRWWVRRVENFFRRIYSRRFWSLGSYAKVSNYDLVSLRKSTEKVIRGGREVFLMLKPGVTASQRKDILRQYQDAGFDIYEGDPIALTPDQVRGMYVAEVGKTYFPKTLALFTAPDARVIPMLLLSRRSGAVEKARSLKFEIRRQYEVFKRTVNLLHTADDPDHTWRDSGIVLGVLTEMPSTPNPAGTAEERGASRPSPGSLDARSEAREEDRIVFNGHRDPGVVLLNRVADGQTLMKETAPGKKFGDFWRAHENQFKGLLQDRDQNDLLTLLVGELVRNASERQGDGSKTEVDAPVCPGVQGRACSQCSDPSGRGGCVAMGHAVA